MIKIESSEYATLKSSRVKNAARVVCREIFFMVLLSVCLCYLVLSGLTQAVLADELEASNSRPLSVVTDTVEPLAVLQFDIPRQRADGALTALGQQADITVVYRLDWVKPFYTNALQGSYALPDAVAILLADTGLTARLDSKGHLIISQKNGRERESMNLKKMNSKKKLLAATIGFFVGGGVQGASAQEVAAAQDEAWLLEEVVVTATKRATRLQDTPMSISAITSNDIDKRGLVGMGDYLATIPGVSQADYGVGRNRISIRGIVTSPVEEATVAAYLGQTPLNKMDAGGTATDIKLIDLERVEVLRGPQGTLYGSGSLGGAVRNIPNKPNLGEYELKVNVGLSKTKEASGINNKTTGVLNVPLVEDELALRIVAYRIENQGYTDLVSSSDSNMQALSAATGAGLKDDENIGDTEFSGGRMSLLWRPIENFSANLMYLTQDLEQDGFNEVTIDKGGYSNVAFDWDGHLGGGERLGDDVEIGSLTLEYDLGWATLFSSTTVRKDETERFRDLSRLDSFLAGTVQSGITDFEGFYQEARMASSFDSPFQIVGGVYYEDLELVQLQDIAWVGDDALLSSRGLGGDPDGIYGQRFEDNVEQKAVFGELSYSISDHFQLTLGKRWFEYDRRLIDEGTGLFGGPIVDIESDESGSRNKINLSYTPNDETLLYAQWTQGFRLGRPLQSVVNPACDADNDGVLDGTSLPVREGTLDADTTDNYELGGKISLMDQRLTVNASLYYIEWTDLPITTVLPCAHTARFNGGDAEVRGFGLETNYFLSEALMMSFGISYNEGELSEDNSIGAKGDRLPLTPRSNASLGVEYNYQLFSYEGFFRADYSYVGSYYSDLKQDTEKLGGYDKLSLRAGISITDKFDVEVYGNNVTDSDELTLLVFGLSNRGVRVPPAQAGVDFRYKF